MARIAGVDIPGNKKVVISLTYIYGIGMFQSEQILSKVKIDLNKRTLNVLLEDDELKKRREIIKHQEIVNQSPWQEIYRNTVGQLSEGGIIELAEKYKKIRKIIPRHSH